MRNRLRIIGKPMSTSSLNSLVSTPVSSRESSSPGPATTPPMPAAPVQERGVGLSDPEQSSGRRRMLKLVNRMHNTG